MPEKTKQEKKRESAKRQKSDNKPKNDKAGTWGEDQKEKSYYYDDSYGYEIYNPDKEDEDEV